MYITSEIAKRIKDRAKYKKIPLKEMLTDLEVGINAISALSKGKQISCITLARIADYLDCSVDYLLCRTDIPEKISMTSDEKRKAIQARIMTMTEAELKRLEDILNYVTSASLSDSNGV